MAMSVQYRQQEGSLGRGGMMVIEKDDDLSLFLEMRDSDMEKKNNLSLVHNTQQFDDLLEKGPESSLISETTAMINSSESQADDLLSIENNKNDYEWLLAPPENPLIPSVEKKVGETATSRTGKTNARATGQQPRLANPAAKPASGTSKSSIRSSATSNAGIRKPSPSMGPTSTSSRSTTPAARPTLPSTTKPSRPSTPTSRATSASSKPSVPLKRSSTPTISSARSSTPTARPSASRSSTPTHRPSATSGPTERSSSVTKSTSTASKNPVPSRGNSPAVKARPALESRGRPTLPIVKVSSSTENGRLRRNSISPSRGKLTNDIGCRARGYSEPNDDVNPVLMGTKMVERVVNMRKLAPPKQDDPNSASGKSSSSQEKSGFGRSLSQKSLDMALRHMDIRRSMPGNLRAMITKVPASSMYSVRSDSIKSKTVSASDSPLATSSSGSSDLSFSNNSHGSTEVGDNDFRSTD